MRYGDNPPSLATSAAPRRRSRRAVLASGCWACYCLLLSVLDHPARVASSGCQAARNYTLAGHCGCYDGTIIKTIPGACLPVGGGSNVCQATCAGHCDGEELCDSFRININTGVCELMSGCMGFSSTWNCPSREMYTCTDGCPGTVGPYFWSQGGWKCSEAEEALLGEFPMTCTGSNGCWPIGECSDLCYTEDDCDSFTLSTDKSTCRIYASCKWQQQVGQYPYVSRGQFRKQLISPEDDCVRVFDNFNMKPRTLTSGLGTLGDFAKGYSLANTGLYSCFLRCQESDVIVWNQGPSDSCQCWDYSSGYYAAAPWAPLKAFDLSSCR